MMEEHSPLRRMKLVLPRELSRFIEEQVSQGTYDCDTEVIVDALWLLRQKVTTPEERRRELEQALLEGLQSGAAEPWSQAEMLAQCQAYAAADKRAYAIDDLRDVLAYLERIDSSDAERVASEAIKERTREEREKIINLLFRIADRLEAIEGIRRGLEEVKAGSGRPAKEVLEEIREMLQIPADAKRPESASNR